MSNEDDNEVTVIDINTKKIIRVVENVGIEPEGVTFSPDGKRVFVTSEGTNTVIIKKFSIISITFYPEILFL